MTHLELAIKYEKQSKITNAIKELKKAIKENPAVAYYKLGMHFFYNKEDNKKNKKKAFFFFNSSAKLDNINAIEQLCLCYDSGTGVKEDKIESFIWKEKGAELGSKKLLMIVYRKYKSENNNEKAFHFLQIGFNQDSKEFRYLMGESYLIGLGVEQNLPKAFDFFKEGSKEKDLRATYKVAEMLENGIGVEKDVSQAIKWYEMVRKQYQDQINDKKSVFVYDSESIVKQSLLKISNIYEKGIGVDQDKNIALSFYKAAEQLCK